MNKYAFIIIQLIPFAGFIWSSLFFFQKKLIKSVDQILINVIGFSLIATNLYLTYTNVFIFDLKKIIGGTLMAVSGYLFFWSIYTLRKNPPSFAFSYIEKSFLIMHGPYRFIRHPLYSSYIFGWIGGCLINQHWFLYAGSSVLIFQYLRSSRAEEKGFLEGPVKENYLQYKKQTGRFLPRI